jgi:integrase
MSGKTAARAEAAWTAAGLNRITLHECRHTYASLLMAAGYTIKELMEFMGHADLQMVNRFVKLVPQPGQDDAAARRVSTQSARRDCRRVSSEASTRRGRYERFQPK